MEDLPLDVLYEISSYLSPIDLLRLKNSSKKMKELLRKVEKIPEEDVKVLLTDDPYRVMLDFSNESQGSFRLPLDVFRGGVAMNFYEEYFQRGNVLLDAIPNFLKAIKRNGTEELFFNIGSTKGVFQNPNYLHLTLVNNNIQVEIVHQFMDEEDVLQQSITSLPLMFIDQWIPALIQLQNYIRLL